MDPIRNHQRIPMPTNLSIKNVPDPLAQALRERAARSHRSLQGELMNILESAVAPRRRLSAAELLAEVRAEGLSTPSESTAWIRSDRESR
jgi:plasmid stability protein